MIEQVVIFYIYVVVCVDNQAELSKWDQRRMAVKKEAVREFVEVVSEPDMSITMHNDEARFGMIGAYKRCAVSKVTLFKLGRQK